MRGVGFALQSIRILQNTPDKKASSSQERRCQKNCEKFSAALIQQCKGVGFKTQRVIVYVQIRFDQNSPYETKLKPLAYDSGPINQLN
jgi:hypothetical protein